MQLQSEVAEAFETGMVSVEPAIDVRVSHAEIVRLTL